MSRKVAPTLQGLVDDCNRMADEARQYADKRVVRQARAELRDLLAVVRAAKRHKNAVGIPVFDHGGEIPSGKALCRALARLDRVSR